MTDSVRFEVKGLRQLGANLRELGDVTARKISGQMTGAAARVVKEATKQNIRNHAYDTGTLEAAVIVKKLSKSQAGDLDSAHIVTPRHRKTGKRGSRSRAKQQTAPHALYIEFGTVHMAAEPVLGPGLKDNIGRALQAMKDKGEKGIALAAKRLRK